MATCGGGVPPVPHTHTPHKSDIHDAIGFRIPEPEWEVRGGGSASVQKEHSLS